MPRFLLLALFCLFALCEGSPPCAFWCVNTCDTSSPTKKYYCCSEDPTGNPDNFIHPPCEKISKACMYTHTTYTNWFYTAYRSKRSIIINSSFIFFFHSYFQYFFPTVDCPPTGPPFMRNCVKEMDRETICLTENDCKENEICCPDHCLLDDQKICKKIIH